MCRLVAYFGEREVSLSALALEPEHSLLVQSHAPREMLSGVVNADGFGAGWYAPEVDEEPAVYRSVFPMWSDGSFESVARKVRSKAVFAALRNATPPLPTEESAIPPFSSGRYMFMHNGAIDGFRETVMRPLRDALSERRYRGVFGASDSETIFACLLDRLDGGASLREALLSTIRFVSEACAEAGTRASLNLALTDGAEMVFARHATEGPDNSLYFVEESEAFPEAVVVASEKLDGEAGWREVPSRSLLCVDGERNVKVEEMPR